jgi:hypothetical protein
MSVNMTLPAQVCFNPKVDSFSAWKVKFTVYAEMIGIESMFKIPTTKDEKTNADIDRKAKLALLLSLDNDSIMMLRDVETSDASNLWMQLLQQYERKSAAAAFHLKMQMMNESLNSNESINNLITRINALAQQRKLIDDPVSDSDLLFYLIKSVILDKRFSNVASTMNMVPNMNYDTACNSLRDHEITLPLMSHVQSASTISNDQTSALVNYVSNVCQFCHKPGHTIEKCDYKNKTCFKCHKSGHKASNCELSKDAKCNFIGNFVG